MRLERGEIAQKKGRKKEGVEFLATAAPYIDMVSAALIALEDPKGTSRQALLRDCIQCCRDTY